MIEDVSHWGKGAPRLKHKGAVKDALALNRKPWICDGCGEGTSVHPDGGLPCGPCGRGGVRDKASGFHRRRIFSLSLGDWLDKEVRRNWLSEMLYTIFRCDQVIWILCTKRPENWRELVAGILTFEESKTDLKFREWLSDWLIGNAPKNIILLTSVENNKEKQRIVDLLKIPAACRGLSIEPMLGPVNLRRIGEQLDSYQYRGNFYDLACENHCTWAGFEDETISNPEQSDKDAEENGTTYVCPICHCESGLVGRPHDTERIDWVIFGGESGVGARPCNVQWFADGVKQCRAAGVAPFVKQLGAMPQVDIESPADGNAPCGEYRYLKLKDNKGGDINEFPPDLRLREFPNL